jgi:hypothetical protein
MPIRTKAPSQTRRNMRLSRPAIFPRLNAMLVAGPLSAALETLDHWQREDPMVAYLRSHPQTGFDPETTPVNRIPWIHAAIADSVPDESARSSIDVVGFLFDYIFRDPSIPSRFRMILSGLQIPILKVALAEPRFFVDEKHPARRLVESLAAAAAGTDDDQTYAQRFEASRRRSSKRSAPGSRSIRTSSNANARASTSSPPSGRRSPPPQRSGRSTEP